MRLYALALISVLFVLVASGCDFDDSGPATTPSADASVASSTSTPIAGASSVIRLDTFEPVSEAFVSGRVPLGLINEVMISRAGADIHGFYIGADRPQDLRLDLSIVTGAPRRDLIEFGGHAYEWWFSSRDQADDYPLLVDDADPELKVSIRHVEGAWGLYVDEGDGWTPLDGTFRFGVYEVSVSVRIDESWRALSAVRNTYVRALIRHDEPTAEGFQVGDVYPRDGSWFFISR